MKANHSFIVRHAVLVIVVWIVIALLSAPLALRIDEVTNYNAQRLLPNGTDSMRANQLLSEINKENKEAAALALDIVIVQGINTSDPRLVEWDEKLNKTISNYASDYTSPYSIIRETLEEINGTLDNITDTIYDSTVKFVKAFNPLYENRSSLLGFLNTTNKVLLAIWDYGNHTYANMSAIHSIGEKLYENLTSFKNLYVSLCSAYNQSMEGLNRSRQLVMLSKEMIMIGDKYYSELVENTDQTYGFLVQVNATFSGLNRMYYNVSRTYTSLVYDVARIHYYLLTHTSAYSGSLNETVVEQVVNYTALSGHPVSPQLVYEVYSIVKTKYDPWNMTDHGIFSVASIIYSMEIGKLPPQTASEYVFFLSTYNVTLYQIVEEALNTSSLHSIMEVLGIGPVEGQLTLYNILQKAGETAIDPTVRIFAQNMAPLIVEEMHLPQNTTTAIQELLMDALKPGYPPDKKMYTGLVINDTVNLFTVMTGKPALNSTYVYFEELYVNGPSKVAAEKSLQVFLAEVFPVPRNITGTIYNVIISVDPGGEGILATNETLALNISIETVSRMTTIPSSILYKIYVNETSIPYEAYQLLKLIIINMTGTESLADIADPIYKYHGIPNLQGFEEALDTAFTVFIGKIMPIPSKDVEELVGFLAPRIWVGNLTVNDTVRLVALGELAEDIMPLINTSTTTTGGGEAPVSSIILKLMYSPIIDSLINKSYTPENPEPVIETYVELAELFTPSGKSAFNITPAMLRELAEKLVRIKNPSETLLARVFADVIAENIHVPGKGEFSFNKTVVEEIIVDILAENIDPLDSLMKHLPSMIPAEYSKLVKVDTLTKALRKAVSSHDPAILYNALYNDAFTDIFKNITTSMKGLMISPKEDAFLIIFKPLSEPSKYDNSLKIKDLVADTLYEAGFMPSYVGVTGDDVLTYDTKEATSRDLQMINTISMIAPFIIALILMGGLIAAGLPFIGIGLSVLLSSAILYLLGYFGVVSVTSWARMLMVTTSFGLGMDYASYITLRFKEKIAELKDPVAAAHDALKYSLPAIAAASSTDIIGFAVMMLAWDFPLLSSIGQMVPITILAVLAASLTFTPALLARFGDKKWFWWPHRVESGRHGWRGFTLTKRRAVGLLLLSLVVGGIGAYGLFTFEGSHDYSVFMPQGTPSYEAYVKLQEVFPAGQLMPIYIVGRISGGSIWDKNVLDTLKQLASKIKGIDGVVEVYGPQNPGDKPKTTYVSRDNKTFYLEVIIQPSPMSRQGIELTKKIREIAYSYRGGLFSELYVGGLAATSLELEELLDRDFWGKIFPVGLVLMWVAMTLSFMSIWPGIISLSTITIGYLVGVTLASKIPGLYGQPALWFLPLMTFPAVLGVGMDYNSFYMNRQREELGKLLDREDRGYLSATRAIKMVSHLVIGLGLIVTSTYSALLLGSTWGERELGLALAGGVFTTTLMAALILTPSILALMAEKAWWPYSRRWKKK